MDKGLFEEPAPEGEDVYFGGQITRVSNKMEDASKENEM
jgi:hypothetical protein